MALQSSGQISLSDIATEFGGTAPHSLSEYYGKGNAPASGEIELATDFYGTSNITLANPTNSLRLDYEDSSYLERTFSSSDTKKWTMSVWMKPTMINVGNQNAYAMGAGTSNFEILGLADSQNGGQYIRMVKSSTNIYYFNFTASLNDNTHWYHIVMAYDSAQATASDRVKFWVDGSQVTSFSTSIYPSQNETSIFNTNIATSVGRLTYTGNHFSDAWFAEMHFVDGYALDDTSFASGGDPIVYSGSYGTNGFYLPFSNSSNLGEDFSGNNNDFTSNNITSSQQSTDVPP